jgi:glycosylphosphatidylinositol transamidase
VIGLVAVSILPHQAIHDEAHADEKALLIGQVTRYFGEAEVTQYPQSWIDAGEFADAMEGLGLDVSTQHFEYRNEFVRKGINVQGIYRAPRGEGTEALVLLVPRTVNNQTNYGGIQMLFSFAKFVQRFSFWARDMVFVITEQDEYGVHSWLEAYHGKEPSHRILI